MRKALPACLAAACFALPATAAAQADQEPPLESQVREGHAQRPAGRAREPRGAAGPSRAPHGPHRRGAAVRPADAAQHARGRRRRLPARRGGPPGHRAGPELRREPLGLPLLLAAGRHARGRPDDADLQRGRRARRRARRRTSTSSRARCASRASSSSGGELDLDTEQKIIDVPVDRGICCHVGGQIAFDPQGNLYLSTGDDSNPFESDGYTPIDERADPQPGVRRPAHRRQHERPARQAAAHPRRAPTAATTSRRATCSRGARRRPSPRSTSWACATRSASTSTRRTGDVYMADYSPDANEPTRRAGRPATAAGC